MQLFGVDTNSLAKPTKCSATTVAGKRLTLPILPIRDVYQGADLVGGSNTEMQHEKAKKKEKDSAIVVEKGIEKKKETPSLMEKSHCGKRQGQKIQHWRMPYRSLT